ncbi:MAG TPA: GntR family transcriptional regulator [Shinella sp.]|uniref:GntR family transcriptional regulator n=1 Tax=Shinella lacus TaxID=2654216 RepID=A0ABT1RCX3_9HYPH|nr:GntR family transcriptional regulator [Shinella sp.]MCQ4633039.1 GntR family transcriptional regulator [Shinella lacus]MDX3976307.1 GntR family transcriptional regulator [Shinella sp.]HEV7249307.1 GntR family transcriptional regulator [Shinella sp.]
MVELSSGAPFEADEIDESDIVERIFEAVIEQRLPPGTKLSESALCDAFGVGRMRIRRSLLLLASREVVELHANRGAFVASPTPEQAREVFEARLALEPNIARLAVHRASEEDISALTRHLEMEYVAHKERRRHDAIRLSGQFHTLMAQVAGNAILIRTMKELVTRTSLIIGLFGSGVSNCRDDDHAAIVGAFHTRDAEKAAWMMTLHLRHIQNHLELGAKTTDSVDLMALFGKA